ncbi:MAG: arsenate reductase ArsC [Mucilaginibacter polytrichastri]|nr:arsenate reductase ArsC [Mucilaginibacter polytrichastri]
MKNILVLCTGNSCRSQIAEGYLRYFGGDDIMVYSAGVETHGLNLRAVQVMAEDGIDISRHTSDHIDRYVSVPFDHVITVCDHAREACPWFPAAAMRTHRNFPDPAKATGDEETIMKSFRDVRNRIKAFAEDFIKQTKQ